MADFFLDTSAVVKRYVREIGTTWVQGLTGPGAGNTLFLAHVTLPETVAAVTRRERGGHIAPTDAARALSDFYHDIARQYRVVAITAGVLDRAASLARIYGLRGYDAVQLAAALEIRPRFSTLTLISADRELNAAAGAEGLPADDPNSHP